MIFINFICSTTFIAGNYFTIKISGKTKTLQKHYNPRLGVIGNKIRKIKSNNNYYFEFFKWNFTSSCSCLCKNKFMTLPNVEMEQKHESCLLVSMILKCFMFHRLINYYYCGFSFIFEYVFRIQPDNSTTIHPSVI